MDHDELSQIPMRILLVDDEALLLMHLVDIVEELGYAPIAAGSGSEALVRYQAEAPINLVITDYSMPGMNGCELARALKQENPSLTVILASGYGDSHDTSEIDFTLPKPFTFADVERAIVEAARVL